MGGLAACEREMQLPPALAAARAEIAAKASSFAAAAAAAAGPPMPMAVAGRAWATFGVTWVSEAAEVEVTEAAGLRVVVLEALLS